MSEPMAAEAEKKQWAEVRSEYQGISPEDYSEKVNAGEFDPYLKDPSFKEEMNSGKLFEKPEQAGPEGGLLL